MKVSDLDDIFSKRELDLINNCIDYSNRTPSGLPAHNIFIIVAKLAAIVDRLGGYYPKEEIMTLLIGIINRVQDDTFTRTRDALTASEAIYGFMGWLTSGKEKVPMPFEGWQREAVLAADLANEFCQANNLQDPEDGFGKRVVHPDAKQEDSQ